MVKEQIQRLQDEKGGNIELNAKMDAPHHEEKKEKTNKKKKNVNFNNNEVKNEQIDTVK